MKVFYLVTLAALLYRLSAIVLFSFRAYHTVLCINFFWLSPAMQTMIQVLIKYTFFLQLAQGTTDT